MGKLVSYDDHCRILGDNASLGLIACVYCVCRIDEADGLAFRFSPLRKNQLPVSAMASSFMIMFNTGPSDVNMQLIAIALAVAGAVAVLAFRTHAARRILDVTCNVRQHFGGLLVSDN